MLTSLYHKDAHHRIVIENTSIIVGIGEISYIFIQWNTIKSLKNCRSLEGILHKMGTCNFSNVYIHVWKMSNNTKSMTDLTSSLFLEITPIVNFLDIFWMCNTHTYMQACTHRHTHFLKTKFHSPVLYLNILNLIIHVRDHSVVKG